MIDKRGVTLRGFVHAEFDPYRCASVGYLRTVCIRNSILITLDSNYLRAVGRIRVNSMMRNYVW